ncbi:WD repeat-containing protein 74 [Palaemon carinicauda]|uniref:WD repeat-containing protein 74 n=1 Tax=Palaemon carinicauda TaxID=392227 RepID=UPI0035B6139E
MADVSKQEVKTLEDFNVFVGAETGILKGINLNQDAVIHKNVNNLKSLDRQHEVTAMAWGNHNQTEVLIGLRNKIVQVFDTEDKAFVSSRQITIGEGPIVSLARWNGITVTALKSGQVTIWNADNPVEINAMKAGETLARMRQSRISPNIIATGGKENELNLWDLEKPLEPIFKAKNVKLDMVQLRVPVWVTDMAFLKDHHSVGISTRHRNIRLYDPGRQRRPTMDFEWGEYPLTSISAVPTNDKQVVVGASHGRMALFDYRGTRPDMPVHVFKGFAGAVRDIVVHPEHPLVFSVSLDRFVRVHHLWSTKLLFNEYLKSRLNCLLVKDEINIKDFTPAVRRPGKRKKKAKATDDKDDVILEPTKGKVARTTDDDWAALTL